MAVVPRLEISFVRGTGPDLGHGIAIVMRTMPVSVPPHLLGPALFASWFGLAPFFAWQAALGVWMRPPAQDPAQVPGVAPRPPAPDADDPLPDNVLRLPSRRPD
ncbi:MAG TPA: hypothetical protein VFZ01_20050 [Geminicoccaceae bacterium]